LGEYEALQKLKNAIVEGFSVDATDHNKVKENIIHLTPGGNYVVGPICCLPWGVSLNNIMAMPKAIKIWGTYPLTLN
jgi:hypothetical protein